MSQLNVSTSLHDSCIIGVGPATFPSLVDLPVKSALLSFGPNLRGYRFPLDSLPTVLLALPPTLSRLSITIMIPSVLPSPSDYATGVDWSVVRDRMRTLNKLERIIFHLEFAVGSASQVRLPEAVQKLFYETVELLSKELSAQVEVVGHDQCPTWSNCV